MQKSQILSILPSKLSGKWLQNSKAICFYVTQKRSKLNNSRRGGQCIATDSTMRCKAGDTAPSATTGSATLMAGTSFRASASALGASMHWLRPLAIAAQAQWIELEELRLRVELHARRGG
mmetsp:Transcript_15649/g.33946  ORF Transcript_15649/g.33946 Transcript_15649/m.33946 type:complete len:120 (+) Transcript_15649:65-424(+)